MELLFLDCETGGLDCNVHALLEVAWVYVETEGKVEGLHSRGALVLNWVENTKTMGPGLVDEFCHKMHTENGLLEACRNSKLHAHHVDQTLVELLKDKQGQVSLVGRNVGFDLGFLKRNCPAAASMLNYHHLDLRSVERFLRLCGVQVDWEKPTTHRARDDVNADILFYNTMRGVVEVFKDAADQLKDADPVSGEDL